ncbi:hypothetical protein K7711_02600 [Nocardia sp. CA2R105]|uniref:hypothetical protein n=1 Tax=Nocardia coffeae TaxID=2873381 RepID=UPI001CA6CF7D|nr:hypothetical protein [Nocardia coffeae]MBY8855357.1 hypothetical protein [Nocardia coffeae]
MTDEKSANKAVVPLHGRGEARGSRRHRRVPDGADGRVGGFTVSFQVRYVHGGEAERVAAAQARAIAALLRWAATRDAAGSILDQPPRVHDVLGDDGDQERAA